uniref:Uncharacterized protein n=1 Tax=Fagus sylvatica TaxID=28930 RepID=A0A2N9FDS6_FAGSY
MPDEPGLFLIGKNVTLTARVAIKVAVAERFSPTPLWANILTFAHRGVGENLSAMATSMATLVVSVMFLPMKKSLDSTGIFFLNARIKYSSITQNNANPALRKKMPDEPRLFFIGKNVTLTTRGAIKISMAETLSLTPQ